MKKIVLSSLILLPVFILASSVDPESTRYFAQTGRVNDFWPRVVNFTIFAAILYYLAAAPIKSFFKGRSADINTKLTEIETKLQEAKAEEKIASDRLKESEKKAEEILSDAKSEAKLLVNKVMEANIVELSVLEKQLEEKMALESRKSARDSIDEILSENITNDDINIDASKVVDIISKKVA